MTEFCRTGIPTGIVLQEDMLHTGLTINTSDALWNARYVRLLSPSPRVYLATTSSPGGIQAHL